MNNGNMHFTAESKDDIAYYLKSIANIKGVSFDSIDHRFGITVIRCSKNQMDEATFSHMVEEVIREKSHGKIEYYEDPVGGMRITIH